MQQNKKALTNVAAFDRAIRSDSNADRHRIQNKCSTNDAKRQERKKIFLENLLPRGAENAIPARKLAANLGLSTREIGLLVHDARREGINVLSANSSHGAGYFLPSEGAAGRAETERFVRSMTRRGSEIFAALKAARDYLKQEEGNDG